MSIPAKIFLSFAKIGAFTFGGGYAMIPIIENEVVDRRGWIRREDFLTLLTLAQSAPGPISLNTSVFVGYKVAGVWGAFLAVLGVVLPCFLIMLAVITGYSCLKENSYISAAFKGMRPVVVALMAAPLLRFCRSLDWVGYLVALLVGTAIWYYKFSAVWLLLISMAVGLSVSLISVRKTSDTSIKTGDCAEKSVLENSQQEGGHEK